MSVSAYIASAKYFYSQFTIETLQGYVKVKLVNDKGAERRRMSKPEQDRSHSKGRVPRLIDVAQAAGVSTATVSRCLNAPNCVSSHTRVKVMKAVKDLGYAPNFNAKALASRRTHTFGAIIPTMENAIFARGVQAFQDTLRTQGITLLIASSAYDPHLEERQIYALAARGADAMLLIGRDRTESSYIFLERKQIPYVTVWTSQVGRAPGTVGFDNRKAMAQLAAHVFEFGHRNLGYISAPRATNDRARERVLGVYDAMEAHGLDPKSLMIVETPYSIKNGAAAFKSLITYNPRPTAVLCGNDVLAAGAVMCARQMGFDIPGDLSITGFDDIDLSEIVSPPLTTVHVPHRAMGRAAADMLMAMSKGENEGATVELDVEIILRASLGPVPR